MAGARELGRSWFQDIQEHDTQGALALLSDDIDFLSPGGRMQGRDQVAPFIQGYVDGFPDATFEISNVFGSDERAVFEGVWGGTNSGSMMTPQGEMPPTGRAVSLPFVSIIESDGDRITSHRAYWDQMAFLGQLGLVPQGEAP